jgi:hypothetical protein
MRILTGVLLLSSTLLSGFGSVPAWAASLHGSWSGSGYIVPKSGQKESVRCRVSYSPQGTKVVAVSCTIWNAQVQGATHYSVVSPSKCSVDASASGLVAATNPTWCWGGL